MHDKYFKWELKWMKEEENRLDTVFNFFNLYQTKTYVSCIEKGWQKGCYQRNMPHSCGKINDSKNENTTRTPFTTKLEGMVNDYSRLVPAGVI